MGGKRSQALAGDRSSGVSRSLGRVAREGPAPWLVRRETITVCLLERPPGNGGGRPTVHAPTVTRRLSQMWGLMWLQSMFPASVHARGLLGDSREEVTAGGEVEGRVAHPDSAELPPGENQGLGLSDAHRKSQVGKPLGEALEGAHGSSGHPPHLWAPRGVSTLEPAPRGGSS